MRLTTLTIVFLCFCFRSIGADNKQVVAEMQITTPDSVFKFNYLYNNDTAIVVETKSLKINGVWQNISQKEWYPDGKKVPGLVERKWINDAWQDVFKIENSVTENTTTENDYLFSGGEKELISSFETTYLTNKKIEKSYTYTNNNPVLKSEKIFYYKDQKLDSIILLNYINAETTQIYKTSYTYNTDTTLHEVKVLKLQNNGWENMNKTNWYYFSNSKNIRSERNYIWNTSLSNWENSTLMEYEYLNSGKKTSETSSEWNLEKWFPVYRYAYTYDTNENPLKKEFQTPIYRAWRNNSTVNYIFEENTRNLRIESVYGFWGGKAGDGMTTDIVIPFNNETIVRKGQTISITYAPFIETNVNYIKNNPKYKVYPNPSTGIYYINNSTSKGINWVLTNLNGEILKKSNPNTSSSVVDITDLPNGVYLITITELTHNQTLKLVKY